MDAKKLKLLLATCVSLFMLSGCMSDEKKAEGQANDAAPAATEEKAEASAAPEAKEEKTEEAASAEAKPADAAPAAEINAGAAPADGASADTATNAEAAPADDSASPAQAMVSNFREGQHYRKLNFELPTEAPEGKIEVTELFWYGCPHCFNLEPTMKEYIEEKPENAHFRRVPATLNPNWTIHAKAYYIGRLLDADDSKHVHDNIFAAIHKQHRRLVDEESIKSFFISQGFTEEEYDAAANSMEVQSKVKMATDYSNSSQATGVPTLIVNGKYMTSPTMAQGAAKLKRVLNYLVEKEAGTAK